LLHRRRQRRKRRLLAVRKSRLPVCCGRGLVLLADVLDEGVEAWLLLLLLLLLYPTTALGLRNFIHDARQ
jgi:fatty acid desaturase